MIRSELVAKLNEMPDIEVGTSDGTVFSIEKSSYDDESGTHDYIHLNIEDD
jgi:hypothetical protein